MIYFGEFQSMRTVKKIPAKRSDFVYRDLLQQINQGKLMLGERLPTEDDLIKSYDIGRSALRNSLARLQKAGYLSRRQGSGTYITNASETDHITLTEAICIRTTYTEWEGFWGKPLRNSLIQTASANGFEIYFETYNPNQKLPLSVMSESKLAAVIAMGGGDYDPEDMLAHIPDDRIKLVLDRAAIRTSLPSVSVNFEVGMTRVASLLLSLGHKRIAYNKLETFQYDTTQTNVHTLKKVMSQAGLPNGAMFYPGPETRPYDWPQALKEILTRPDRPTALISENPDNMLYMLNVIHSVGLDVPKDLSIIMLDDTEDLPMLTPAISCSRQPLGKMGRMTIELIMALKNIKNNKGSAPENTNILLEPELIIRDSVQTAPKD